jgi:hypothetical protein
VTAYPTRIVGTGALDVIAYGIADAEHHAEKELARLWPDAAFEVTQVERVEAGNPRIAEEFRVGFRIRATIAAEGESPEEALRVAFRAAQQRLAGSRFQRTSWAEAAR